jgi:hypothetical protein
MSLEASLKALLGPLVSGRCWPDVMKDGNSTFPCIVYQQVGGIAREYLDKTLPATDHARVQVWVWSKTRLEASTIARSARVALVGSSLTVETYGAPVSEHNDDLKLYGSRTDYGIWFTP